VDPEKLAAEGWIRQSVASEPRLSEAVQTYESLGFEVLLIPALQECGPEGRGSCTACFEADENPDRYQVIYTRTGPGAAGEDAGLFDA